MSHLRIASRPPSPHSPFDTILEVPAETNVVDTDAGGRLRLLTGPPLSTKQFTVDVTARVQPFRVRLPGGTEFLTEVKPISSLGQVGADVKYKLDMTGKLPTTLAAQLRTHNLVLEFEGSAATRLVLKNGQWLVQGACAVKLNHRGSKDAPWTNLVVGVEFPQFRGDLSKIVNRVVPHLVSLSGVTLEGLGDRRTNQALSPEFRRRFNDIAVTALPPILGAGGQVSLVYPLNPLLERLPGIGAPLRTARAAIGTNSRIGVTFSYRDQSPKVSTRHIDGDANPDLYVAAVDSASHRVVSTDHIDFAQAIFGNRAFDPSRSGDAAAAFATGLNEYQVGTLIPARQYVRSPPAADAREFGSATQSRVLRFGKSDPAVAVRRVVSGSDSKTQRPAAELLELVDQLVGAIQDVRSHLPANALLSVPRVLNDAREATQVVQKIFGVVRSYDPVGDGALLQRFASMLANRSGVNYGVPEILALNASRYGVTAASESVAAAMDRADESLYRVSVPSQGTQGDQPEIVSRRDHTANDLRFSVWHDHQGHRRIGVVPSGVSAYQASSDLNSTLR